MGVKCQHILLHSDVDNAEKQGLLKADINRAWWHTDLRAIGVNLGQTLRGVSKW